MNLEELHTTKDNLIQPLVSAREDDLVQPTTAELSARIDSDPQAWIQEIDDVALRYVRTMIVNMHIYSSSSLPTSSPVEVQNYRNAIRGYESVFEIYEDESWSDHWRIRRIA